jgi:regulator of replication initiation timing
MALSDEVYELEQKYKELRDEVENAKYHENIADGLRDENADLEVENRSLRSQNSTLENTIFLLEHPV